MKRREFLQSGAAAGISMWAGRCLADGKMAAQALEPNRVDGLGQDGYQAPEWLHHARAVYFDGYSPPVNPHMKDFDAQRLLQAVTGIGGDLLRFQPIGYWAYYPSKTFRLHPELHGRDLIDEVAHACRRAGVRLYCYTGYGHPHMQIGWVDQHPEYADWVLRDPQGKAYGTYVHYGDVVQRMCITGDSYRAGIRQVVKELCDHEIEGIYFDAPSAFGYSGVCFCEDCRRNFKAFTGLDLDRLAGMAKLNGLPFEWNGNFPPDADMEALVAWYAWADHLVRTDFLHFRETIHRSGKFMLCHNAQAWTGTSVPMQYRIPDGFMVESSREIYERLMTGMMGGSMARPYKKVAQMYLGSYEVVWFGEPPHEQPRDVTHNTNLEDSDEIVLEGYTDLACGNSPLYATANRLYFNIGSGSTDAVREVFAFMKRTEVLLKDSVPLPYLSIVPTWESQQLWRERGRSWNWLTMSAGMGLTMLDERICFDVNPSTELSEEWLQRQKVIALCGASGVSDEDAKKLTAWVERGGGLLATYDTGLYYANGKLRPDGGALQTVLGVKMKGAPLASLPETYYRITESHEAQGQYAVGTLLEGDGRLVPVEVLGRARMTAECWNLGTEEVRGPAIVVHEYGRGRTIYLSGSLEANYLYDRVKSTGQLLRSMVEYLGHGAQQPFKLRAPRGVYGVSRQTRSGDPVVWLLANVGFKDAAAGRTRQEFLPVANVQLSIKIPARRRVHRVHLLRSQRQVPFDVQEGYAVAVISSLHIAEVVHVELA